MASKERRQSTKSKKKCARSDSSTKYPPLDSDKIQRALPRVPSEKQRGGYQFLLPNKLKVKKCTSEPKNARKLSSSEYRPASSDSDENYETLNPELMIQDGAAAVTPGDRQSGKWQDTTLVKAEHLHYLLTKDNLAKVRPYLMSLSGPMQQRVVTEMIGGCTALYLAMKKNAFLLMAYILETCGADANQLCFIPNTMEQMVKSTCLIKAASSGKMEAVEMLVTNGADVNLADEAGWTPLSTACYEGHATIVEYLISSGANIHAITCQNATCLLLAVHSPDILDFLISQGSDVHARDTLGRTALHYAAEWSRLNAVKVLLEHNADVNIQDDIGNTPLHDAVATGNLETVTFLVERGADPYLRNRDKEDAILMAYLERETEKLDYFISLHKKNKSDES